MQNEPSGFRPAARREGIISKEADGELLIYDRVRDRAHCLNGSAAAIWKLCDGQTTPNEIAAKLSDAVQRQSPVVSRQSSVAEEVVWLALTELRRTHLLEESERSGHWPQTILGMSRRDAIRRIGLGAAIAIPVVASITAPTAVQAAVSCKDRCSPCSTGECCSGVCGNSAATGCPGSGNKCA